MVDPDAVVPLPRPGLIVPERIDPGPRLPHPHRIGQPKVRHPAERRPAVRQIQRVRHPSLGPGRIHRLRDHVIVPQTDKRLLGRQKVAHPRLHPRHPGQLVIIFRPRRGVAVRQVQPADPDRTRPVHHRLDPARLFVAVTARQPASHVAQRQLRQDRNPVEPLLAMRLDPVTQRLEDLARKAFIHRLDLLQAHHVRSGRGQPGRQRLDPRLDPVDVERGQLQIEKLVPQPQLDVAFGFCTTKRAPISSSVKSITAFDRKGRLT